MILHRYADLYIRGGSSWDEGLSVRVERLWVRDGSFSY